MNDTITRPSAATGVGAPPAEWLVGDGEVHELVRTLDWATTSLGPRAAWPSHLRTIVDVVLASSYPMTILWGPGLALLYNDGYRVIAGDKHPGAMGRPARSVWPETWEISGPIFERVMTRGETVHLEDQPFRINRKGFPEDAWFTLSCSPLHGERGVVDGMLVVLLETTRRVELERRLAEVNRELESRIAALNAAERDLATSEERLARALRAARLGHWEYDVSKDEFYWAPENYGLCGIDPKVMPSQQAGRDIVDPAEIAFVDKSVAEALAGTGDLDIEYTIIRPDNGQKRVLHSRAEIIRDADGKATRMIGTLQDVTARKRGEDALRRSEQLLAETAAAGKVGGWEVDIDDGKQKWTAVTYRIHEVDPDYEPTVDKGIKFYTAASRPLIEAAVERAVRHGEPFDLELDIITARNNIRSVHVIGAADLEHNRIHGFFQDITKRKLAERLLQARLDLREYATTHSLEEVLRRTLDDAELLTHSAVGFYHFVGADQRTLSLQAWSTRTVGGFCTAAGAGLHYDIDKAGVWVDCVHQRRAVIHNDYAALPHRKGLPEGHAPVIRELVVPIFRDGAIVAILGVGNKPVDYTQADVDAVSVLADLAWEVAERKRMDQALAEGTQRHATILETAMDGFWLVDMEGRLLEVNQTYCRMSGYSAQELVAMRVPDLESVETAADSAAHIRLVAARGQDRFESRHRRKDGSTFDVEVSVLYRATGGGRLECFVRDITDRKALLGRLAQADRLAGMGTMAAGVGHEINNPLTFVLYNVESLARDIPRLAGAVERCCSEARARLGSDAFSGIAGDDAGLLEPEALVDVTDRAKEALDGARRIKDVTRSLAIFARSDQANLATIDLARPIEAAARMASNEVKHRARLVREFGRVPAFRTSEAQLAQVFLNLILNAAHAIEEGHVDANVIGIRTWAAGGSAYVEVRDTGKGIPPEHAARIFEPFFTTRGEGLGSGLGLAICRNIVEGLGGDIRMESEVGKGTRFVVRLPMDTGEAVSPAASLVPGGAAPTARRGRVLVIDDEEPIRKTIARLLGREHEVVAACSGREGRAVLERDPAFDVILCDLMMPEISGMELHAWLSQVNPALARRTVFITGGAFTPRAAQFLASVDNARFEKPFEAETVKRAVADMIDATGDGKDADARGERP